MKRHALTLLALVNTALALGLTALWFDPDGSLRNAHWQAPEPVKSDYLQMLPRLPERTSVDTSRFLVLLERPLFSMTRRPPPPPPPPAPPAPPPPVDHLATAKLYGAFAGENTGGVIQQIFGKNRRLRLNETVDGWVLKSTQGRNATFTRNGETRVLQLSRSAVSTYSGLAAPVPPPAPPVPHALEQAAALAAAPPPPNAVPSPPPPATAQPAPRRSLFGP